MIRKQATQSRDPAVPIMVGSVMNISLTRNGTNLEQDGPFSMTMYVHEGSIAQERPGL